MPEREILRGADPCDLAYRWAVDPSVLSRLILAADDFWEETRGTVRIISGYRTRQEQARLGRAGRPAARDELSTHRSCPATGVDVNIGLAPIRIDKQIWGRILRFRGLRWGGGSKVDVNGIPSDWQHVDAGPRGATSVPPEGGGPRSPLFRATDQKMAPPAARKSRRAPTPSRRIRRVPSATPRVPRAPSRVPRAPSRYERGSRTITPSFTEE